jgi:hypothetical protein
MEESGNFSDLSACQTIVSLELIVVKNKNARPKTQFYHLNSSKIPNALLGELL